MVILEEGKLIGQVAPAEVGHKVKLKPKKICPILSLGQANYEPCREERCAWYDGRARSCAILILAWET